MIGPIWNSLLVVGAGMYVYFVGGALVGLKKLHKQQIGHSSPPLQRGGLRGGHSAENDSAHLVFKAESDAGCHQVAGGRDIPPPTTNYEVEGEVSGSQDDALYGYGITPPLIRQGRSIPHLPFISIIIAARNEERRIDSTLRSLLAQDYPTSKFEIVVVDDRSEDKTSEIVEQFQINNANLKLVKQPHILPSLSPKKQALQLGIGHSRGEIIVTTDADCLHDPTWLRSLVVEFHSPPLRSRGGLRGGQANETTQNAELPKVSKQNAEFSDYYLQSDFSNTPPYPPLLRRGGLRGDQNGEPFDFHDEKKTAHGADFSPDGKGKYKREISESHQLIIPPSNPPRIAGGKTAPPPTPPYEVEGEVMGGMVVGQARFLISSESPLWQRLQALDFQAQGLMAAGLISFGTPYNCTGASLAYTREAYDNVNGWAGVNHLISGDDELLMSKMSDAGYRIIASPHPQCVVKTTPVETLKDLWQQRIRWGSKGLHYKPSKILVLSGVFLFYLMLVLTPIGLYLGGSFPLFALLFGFKLTLDAVILLSGNKLYNDTFYWAEYILMALLHPVFIVALAIGGAFSSFEWKGQTFKQTSAQ